MIGWSGLAVWRRLREDIWAESIAWSYRDYYVLGLFGGEHFILGQLYIQTFSGTLV